MSIVILEVQVRIFILGRGKQFPDEEVVRLAQREIGDDYIDPIKQRARAILDEYANDPKAASIPEGEKPIVVQKAKLLLAYIDNLNQIETSINPQPTLDERVESDRAQGSINRSSLNL